LLNLVICLKVIANVTLSIHSNYTPKRIVWEGFSDSIILFISSISQWGYWISDSTSILPLHSMEISLKLFIPMI